jgi:two-component system phosphate regulon response regulator PhoB
MSTLIAQEGFTPVTCGSAAEARLQFKRKRPVAILLDWVLPDSPGTELCREFRSRDPAVTIMFVSGRNDETSVTRGLDAGADDFLSKPVREGELIARLEAQLRKVARLRSEFNLVRSSTRDERMTFGELEIDPLAREVRVSGKIVKLGPLQYRLLDYLARNAGVAVSRGQILNEVYGIGADIRTDRVDLIVQRLRRKLGDYPDRGGHIVAHPGYGYRLERGAAQ